ncbi:MAG: DHH family phosphoesterase [Deltaproteobacteria bacterium]|jgi:nanoRNase/pAp phosphatase (c-di-AMP/oligoRNAs hydrolase)|nr:DHH family phosphoesterase [Deltaproteobacteria bacterium]
MISKNKEKLARFYEQFGGSDQVLILINADPDAIASAMAVKRLLWRKVAGIVISHINVIQRPDNLTMTRLLGVPVVHRDAIEPDRFQRKVLIDSQPNHNEVFSRFRYDVIIDHHPDTHPQAGHVDIRPRYGATASIMTEYLRAAKIKPSTKLATGLFHAIKTDTRNFERETQIEDVIAFQYLFRYANIPLARRIEQADLQPGFLTFFRKAIQARRFRKGKMFAHLGPVPSADVCVLVADFFMRVETVTWSIVSGICDEQLVVILRNDGIRKNAGSLARSSFGEFGSAGGHKTMARAELALAAVGKAVDCSSGKRLTEWLVNRIEQPTWTSRGAAQRK